MKSGVVGERSMHYRKITKFPSFKGENIRDFPKRISGATMKLYKLVTLVYWYQPEQAYRVSH